MKPITPSPRRTRGVTEVREGATPTSEALPPAEWRAAGVEEGAAGTSAAGWPGVVEEEGPWRGEEGAAEVEGACGRGAAS